MNIEHRRILRDKRDFLMKNINFQYLEPLLLEYKIFNKYMWKDVVSMEDLLTALPHRGPKAFHNIIEIFRKTGYIQEADALEDSETKLFHKMSSQPLGYCLIINNVKFQRRKQDNSSDKRENLDRLGSDTDAESLKCFFKTAGFEVIVKRDMRAVEMIDFFKRYSTLEDLTKLDSLIVIILSHGAQINNVDIVYGIDWNYIQKPDILNIFDNFHCERLSKKPKIFLFISCRGNGMDYGVSYCIPNESVDTGCKISIEAIKCEPSIETLDTDCNIILPTISETYLVHSTLPCKVSLRDLKEGSFFCQALINVLNRNFQTHDLHSIINCVNLNLLCKVSSEYRICQSAHYETLATTKSVKFCQS